MQPEASAAKPVDNRNIASSAVVQQQQQAEAASRNTLQLLEEVRVFESESTNV